MKTLLCICAALAMTLSAATARAANVTGAWTAEMTTPDGNSFQLTFTFKQDGAKLTGSVQGPMGEPMEISNGKIDGDKLSFDVSFNGMTIHHDCTVTGNDEIKMTTRSDNQDFPGLELTLKRVKETPATAEPATPPTPAQPPAPAQPPQ